MTERGIEDIRYLPWEAKRPRKIKPLRLEPPPLLTVERLEPHHCRWPVSDNSPYEFCGADKAPGGHSYCPYHVQISRKGYT